MFKLEIHQIMCYTVVDMDRFFLTMGLAFGKPQLWSSDYGENKLG